MRLIYTGVSSEHNCFYSFELIGACFIAWFWLLIELLAIPAKEPQKIVDKVRW